MLETDYVILEKLTEEFPDIEIFGCFAQELEEHGSLMIPNSHKILICEKFKEYCSDYNNILYDGNKLSKFLFFQTLQTDDKS